MAQQLVVRAVKHCSKRFAAFLSNDAKHVFTLGGMITCSEWKRGFNQHFLMRRDAEQNQKQGLFSAFSKNDSVLVLDEDKLSRT